MANHFPGVPSNHGMNGSSRNSQERPEGSGSWFLSRKEIEDCSPSRRHGIDLKKESYLRKSYCTFLQDLGMRLKVPQVTIATSIIFCHRFFLRQSHAKNDRRTIATVCMFLAGKVEESPRPLKDVIIVSYEIIYKKDPAAALRIKQKEIYEQQKELILLGERLVLATLDFDFNLLHPYKPLVEAIKKFKVAQNALAQVAWNFVNDGLRTSLCLQFKPHHIAAGAIFLAAKFLKVKLPSDGDKVWWQEFDVTPRQLEEVSNQMLELYEQNRMAPSQASEAEGSAGVGVISHQPPSKAPTSSEVHATDKTKSQGGDTISKPTSAPPHYDGPSKSAQNKNSDYRSTELKDTLDQKSDGEVVNQQNELGQSFQRENLREPAKNIESGSENGEDGTRKSERRETNEAIKKIDKDKVRAILEKRKKAKGEVPRKVDAMGEEDLIEREIEEGIELGTKTENRIGLQVGENGHNASVNGPSLSDQEFDDAGYGYESPKSNNRKRKAGGLLERD